MQRRSLLRAAAAGPVLLAAPSARAQEFNQAVRIIVPFGPGGTSDILARLIAAPLQARIGQNVIVENRPGAGGNIGADAVAKSRPDGHSMVLLDVSVLATNPLLFQRMPFDVQRDLAAVQMVIFAPYILAVNNQLPVQNAAELAAYAKANPGKLNAANSGTGTLTHIVALSLAAYWGGRDGARALSRRCAGASLAGVERSQPDDGRRDAIHAVRRAGPDARHRGHRAPPLPQPA